MAMLNSRNGMRAGLFVLALAGCVSAADIAYTHLVGIEACPTIGPVPACYVVAVGYLAIAFSALRRNGTLFVLGWMPVIAFATMGVTVELASSTPICPSTESGIPKCFISLALAAAIGVLGWLTLMNSQQKPAV